MSEDDGAISALHDHALAKLFVDQMQDEIRYVTGKAKPTWFVKDGTTWRRDTVRSVEFRTREFLDALNTEGSMRLGSDRTIRAVVAQSGNDPRIAINSDEFDRDHHLLGTPEGIIDLRTGKVFKPIADPLVSKRTLVPPALGAPHPAWDKFLHQVTMGKKSLVKYLQTWAGYCLTGETADHAMLILYGSGRNGKSTFIERLADILGDYSKVPDRNLFVSGGRTAHFSATSHLMGARLVAMPEIERGATWNEALLKAFTGEDTIDSKGMWAEQSDFRPTGKLIVGTNDLPDPKAVNKALTKRLQILNILFSAAEEDTRLKADLLQEYPAILAWMIEGAKRYYRRIEKRKKGIRVPHSVSEWTEDYFSQFDFFEQWWSTTVKVEEGAATSTADISSSFNRYLAGQGEQSWTSVEIGKAMSEKGFRSRSERVRGTQVRRHHGIQLRRKVKIH